MSHRSRILCKQGLAVLLPLATLTVPLGCRPQSLAGGISDSTFVAAMAGLRRLPAHAMVDSASRMRARDSILKHYGLTTAQLEAAAASLSSNPDRAAAVWDAVGKKENAPRDVDRTVPKPAPAK